MPLLRLCILSSKFPPVYSGGGKLALTLAKELVRQGNEVLVIADQFDGLPAFERSEGVEINRIGYSRASVAKAFYILLSTLINHRKRYDVVLFFRPDGGFYFGWLLIPFLHGLGKKTAARMSLLNSSDPLGISRKRFSQLRLLPYRLHDSVISISSALSLGYEAVFGSSKKLLYIPNGVNTDLFRPIPPHERKLVLRQLNLPDSFRYCSFVGRPSYRKGLDILIEAWETIVRWHPHARLLLVGPTRDSYRQVTDDIVAQVRTRIDRHKLSNAQKLSDTIIWTGPTTCVERYLQISDLFLFPSRREGCPNALLEAMSCGLPVVCTHIDKITDELVTDSVDGFVTNLDAKEFAERAIELLSSPDKARQFGNQARQRVVSDHAIPIIAKKYVQGLARL